ncbi:MAG: hypothetical protein RIS35_2070, partial [Pseudomonadota bacterium]
MEPESRYTLVGAAVLTLIGCAVAMLLWLSGGGGSKDSRFYSIVFEQQSLEGLQVGSDVNMRGVKVGRVEGFTIDRDNINRVKVRIRVDAPTPVSENTVAVVARNLLTGLARVNLETPGRPGPELLRPAKGQPDPLIPEGNSGIERIAESANRLALSSERALANLNGLLTPENVRTFAEALAGARDATLAFQASAQRIAQVVERADARLPALATQTEGFLREAGVAVGQARSTLRAFEHTAGAIAQQAESIGRRTDDVSDVALLELRATTRELRRTAELLSQAVERLAEPRAALIGP